MRLAATLTFCLFAGAVSAAECDRWSAKMEEDEGGPVMTATICAQASASVPEAQHLLMVQCGGDGMLAMRFLPFVSDDFPPGGNEEFKAELALSLGQETFALPAQYESMDGAMAFATKIGDPMFEVMMTEKQLVISDPDGKVPQATFALKGSRQALRKVIKSCAQ